MSLESKGQANTLTSILSHECVVTVLQQAVTSEGRSPTAHARKEQSGRTHYVDRRPVFRCEGVRNKHFYTLKPAATPT